ncbi:DUF3866 family protein [Branchiibius cervicis]|uniref:DUF3866 family protein n=1 Tax=Branchiibius cervicis TaxID=908252 RepID=A0ABW2ASF2_9MICO
MIKWRQGTVETVEELWSGACQVQTRVGQDLVPAIAYVTLTGRPNVGDRVLLNVTALEKGLGTGGLALVVATPDRLPSDPAFTQGHVVKARYTPLQDMVLGVDEQDSPHHHLLADADSIDGMPVIAADLHSSVPAIIAGLRSVKPDAKVVYVMTDGGALPLAFSRNVAGLRRANWLTGAITVGQAFGGTLEAVNVHTGLLAARLVLGADVAVVSQGPGNLGTGTRWGFSGTSAGETLNAAHTLGGRAIAALRVSQADERPRHRGLSHHSRTAYGRVALVPADVPVADLDSEFGRSLSDQVDELIASTDGRLRRVDVDVTGMREVLDESPVLMQSMGRGLEQDEAAFLVAAAAGKHVAGLL